RVRVDFGERFLQEKFRGDGGFAHSGKLRFEEANDVAKDFVDVDLSELRRGHFGEIAEAADDAVEVGELGFQSGGAFIEDFLKLRRAKLAGTLEIFNGDLQGEERIAKLVGKASGEFPPGSNALGLHQLFLLSGEG